MFDFLDKTGLKAVLEQIKAKFPSSLPANGGNADTVDGKSIDAICSVDGWYDGDLNDLKRQCSVIAVNAENSPSAAWGTVLCFGGGTGSWVQIYIPNFDTATGSISIFIRHFNGTVWSDWNDISTTKIKSEEFSASTDPWSHIQLFSNSENKKPLAVTFFNTQRMYTVFSYDNYYYLELYNTSMQLIPNTLVNFVLYYMEV